MIETLLRAVLVANAGVTALVGTGATARISPDILPQKPVSSSTPWLPAITYIVPSSVAQYTHDGPGMVRVRIQIDTWATDRIAASALAKAVRDALHAHQMDDDGIQDFEFVTMTNLYEDQDGVRLYRNSTDYYAYAREQAV